MYSKRFSILVMTTIILSVSPVHPQTYYLNVNLNDGTIVTYDISDVNRIKFSGVTSIEDGQKLSHIVKSFKLLQNYPNPFNPSTTIQYEIPKDGEVEISIYDLTGRLIRTIVNQNQQAGTHSAVWNGQTESGSKVASGMYMYTVKYANTVSSKKMLLIK